MGGAGVSVCAEGLAPATERPATGRYDAHAIRAAVFNIGKQDRSIYTLVVLHAVVTIFLVAASGVSSAFAYLPYLLVWSTVFFGLFPFLYFMVGVTQVVHRFDNRRRLAFRALISPTRLAHFVAGLSLLATLMVFQGSFTSIKNALPVWQGGFPYDAVQADIDRILHFGKDPWRYLYEAAGNGLVRSVVEWNYNQGWFIFCFATLFYVAVSYEARAVRTRYMLTYVLTWIVVGNLLAGLFLSAGPAFFGHVTGDLARFAEQMAFLGENENTMHAAVRFQRYLWSLHTSGEPGFGSGISAFPSMHVSLAMLNALFLFEVSRKWGLIAFAYVAFVAASSVYLAWHYAIDGYVGIVLTVAVYFAVDMLWVRGRRAETLPVGGAAS